MARGKKQSKKIVDQSVDLKNDVDLNEEQLNDAGKQRRKRVQLEALEPRILLSADLGIPMPLDDDSGQYVAPEELIIETDVQLPEDDSRLVIEDLDQDIVVPESISSMVDQALLEEGSLEEASFDQVSDSNVSTEGEDASSEEASDTASTPEVDLATQQLAYQLMNQNAASPAAAQSPVPPQVIVVDSSVEEYVELVKSALLAMGFDAAADTSSEVQTPSASSSSAFSEDSWLAFENHFAQTPEQSFSLQGQSVSVHVIGSEQDGLDQLTDILDDYQNLAAVHLLSHGKAGQLRLGSSNVTTQELQRRQAQVKAWGESLTDQGDIYLYGCDVAHGESGIEFVDVLASLTAADVAASNDITGADGDWDLEYETGSTEQDLDQKLLEAYQHNLDATTSVKNALADLKTLAETISSDLHLVDNLSLASIDLSALDSAVGGGFVAGITDVLNGSQLGTWINELSGEATLTAGELAAHLQTKLDTLFSSDESSVVTVTATTVSPQAGVENLQLAFSIDLERIVGITQDLLASGATDALNSLLTIFTEINAGPADSALAEAKKTHSGCF